MTLRLFCALAIAGACGALPTARAADVLGLDEAINRAYAAHPSLAAERFALTAVQARAEREALGTPYTVVGEIENVGGIGDLGIVRSAEITGRIGRVIELGGKRQARQALGAAEVARQQAGIGTTRLEVRARTVARFVEVLADQQRLANAAQRITLAKRTQREVASWVAAARNPESDLHAADIEVAKAELDREHAEHELDAARVSLAASWGASTPDFERVEGALATLQPLPAFENFASRLASTPVQQAARLEAEELAARRRVAVASGTPDITASVGVRRLEALDDQGLVFAVSVPLGSRQRSRLSIAEVDAQVSAVESRHLAKLVEARQELFEVYQELKHARTEFEAVRNKMLPKAEQAVAFTRRGFEAGRFSFVALLQAQTTLFNLRERSLEAAARYHTRRAELERLTAIASDDTP